MIIEEKKIILKDGRECTLRNANADDAEGMIAYLKQTAAETPYLLRYPEEVLYTLELEREILESFRLEERKLMIAAEVEGRLAGNCSVAPVGGRIRVRHRCSIGIALLKEFWGLGIGTAMFESMLRFAEDSGYEQAELEVVADNERGLALYKKMGFVPYGERPHGMKHKDGAYVNEILMIKML